MIDKLSISYSAFTKFILEFKFKADILNLFEIVKLKLFFEDKTTFVKLLIRFYLRILMKQKYLMIKKENFKSIFKEIRLMILNIF